jgi:shikimate kinase
VNQETPNLETLNLETLNLETLNQVVLIGPPGVGKTTAGARLAQTLGTTFRDTDADVEAVTARPVSDIFIEDGEEAFREIEGQAALKALAEHDGVLALGSGAVLDERVQRALGGRTVVYLEADFSTVAKRAGFDRARVVLPGNPRGRLKAFLAERHRLYGSLATITVQTDDADDAEHLAALIAARLRAAGSDWPGPPAAAAGSDWPGPSGAAR